MTARSKNQGYPTFDTYTVRSPEKIAISTRDFVEFRLILTIATTSAGALSGAVPRVSIPTGRTIIV
jgi:hypothetical protein